MKLSDLLKALSVIDPRQRGAEVRLVTAVREIDKGQFEGALMLTTRPVAGVALGQVGLLLFVDQDDNLTSEQVMLQVVKGFRTGDAEIDKRLSGEDGEEWKNG